ncbi:MAG: OmpA family protein [Deltaproteobacteria bacterium]|nr:OmpA family protein [Deltaproteobacteria bacterium]
MNKVVYYCLAALLIFTGCVSTKAHKMVLDESEARLTQLENAKKELEQNKNTLEASNLALEASRQANDKLKKEMADLASAKDTEISSKEKEIAALIGQLEELSSKGIMTSKATEELKQERYRLSASDKAKALEIEGLKLELANTIKLKDEEIATLRQQMNYLNREVERLKLKAGEISSEKEKELANIKSTYETLVKEMQKEIEQGDIKITQAVDRLSVNLVEKILFDSGKAEIKPEGLKILKRVGDILKGVSGKQIGIKGHTDNVPIGAKIRHKYPTNWELSTTRATNVVRYLQDTVGVDPNMLFAAGFSEYRPVAINKTKEGKAQNRRIEIVLLPKDIESVLEDLKK